ncbi:CapA family protein [Nocardioides psychrotolerans]|uniref:CapA family protein n=1 Tax=Nocardioides psychrotolerans TaxID=1005945 RepID=UPI003137EA1E
MRQKRVTGVALLVAVALGVLLLTASQDQQDQPGQPVGAVGETPTAVAPPIGASAEEPAAAGGVVTLAFAGDIHFEGAFTDVPEQRRSTLGRMSRDLRSADVAVVNLESALASPGTPARKELEDAGNRYWFRSDAAALDVLDRSGVDVVSIANNHGADHGLRGIRESVRIAEQSPVAVVGVGRTSRQAFAPHRVTVRGTTVAVHAADASARESAEPTWAVGPVSGPGIASARSPLAPQLLDAVRASAARGDVVVVYLHWGEEYGACPTADQRQLARNLADAGADVIVGTHAHVLLGAGMLDSTYVSYGLGNFYWYHGNQAETGVLRLTVRAGEGGDGGEGGGEVVGDEWRPGLIPPQGGGPQPVTGRDGEQDVEDWRALRGCTGLAPGPGPVGATADTGSGRDLPAFASQVRPVGPALRARMTGSSHDPATCPVPWRDLRLLRLSYVGFDGRAHPGAMVVHADVARDVVGVFAALYRARFPLQRMRLVDAYDGDDDRSMAANNTSGYNCRTVAGQSALSDHAYGRAIDLNPVQNPYVLSDGVLPPAGRRFVDVDRSGGARAVPGVIRRGDVVTRAFARAGWTWGGVWSSPDFQHFSAS